MKKIFLAAAATIGIAFVAHAGIPGPNSPSATHASAPRPLGIIHAYGFLLSTISLGNPVPKKTEILLAAALVCAGHAVLDHDGNIVGYADGKWSQYCNQVIARAAPIVEEENAKRSSLQTLELKCAAEGFVSDECKSNLDSMARAQ